MSLKSSWDDEGAEFNKGFPYTLPAGWATDRRTGVLSFAAAADSADSKTTTGS